MHHKTIIRWLAEIRTKILTDEKREQDTRGARKSDRDDYAFAVYWVARDIETIINAMDAHAPKYYTLQSVFYALRVMKRATLSVLKESQKHRTYSELEVLCKTAILSKMWRWAEHALKTRWLECEKEGSK